MNENGRPTATLELIPHQKANLTQRLMMSAHMQQAIHLLQLPLVELEPFIEQQITLNPILEIDSQQDDLEKEEQEIEHSFEESCDQEIAISDQDLSILHRLDEEWHEHFSQDEIQPRKNTHDDDKLHTYLEQSIKHEISLRDQLLKEAHETFENTEEMTIAEILIGYIESNGFLTTSIREIAVLHSLSLQKVESVLKIMQTFYPYGIGAASIRESFLIQLQCLNKCDHLAYDLIKDHYDDLLHNRIPAIQKKLKCSFQAIQKAIENDIAHLDLHPGTTFSKQPVQNLVADVTLRQENDQLIVEVERDYVPTLRMNRYYLKMLENTTIPQKTKQFIKQHIFSARWLMRNLQQRYSTIERIAQFLSKKQRDFFTKENGQLVSLTMRAVAEELNLHESTIARAVSGKYLFCSRGLLPLKSFFSVKYVTDTDDDMSSQTVKHSILDLIHKENKQKPLSDEKISALLLEKGIKCARRTVTKYRIALSIGNTQQRKKFN